MYIVYENQKYFYTFFQVESYEEYNYLNSPRVLLFELNWPFINNRFIYTDFIFSSVFARRHFYRYTPALWHN